MREAGAIPTLIVEGNIGAGKSTFLRLVAQHLNAHIVYEPHQRWQQIGGENLLDRFYNDTARWAYTFQTFAFITRVVEQEQHRAQYSAEPFHVLERSVFSDRFCFARNCHELGFMSSLEWRLYQEWFEWLVYEYTTVPSAFIYLRTDPHVCFDRIKKRNRSEEREVGFDYLALLHKRHEEWLIHKKDIPETIAKIPVLVLECNEEFEQDFARQKEHMKKIAQFVEQKFNLPASRIEREALIS